MQNYLLFGAGTDPGRVRDHNEDCYGISTDDGLWLVADGMGGHEGGEFASVIARDEVCRSVSEGLDLVSGIQRAHSAVVDAAQEGGGPPNMGSTIVALKSDAQKYNIAWVGDSRAYLWDGKLTQLTRDHSLVQELLDNGQIDKDSEEFASIQNVITQCLGPPNGGEPRVDVYSGEWHGGEKVLLCSDGLHGELSDSEIADIISESGSEDEQARVDALIAAALAAGGKDNVSAILVAAPATLAHGEQAGRKQWSAGRRAVVLSAVAIGLAVLVLYLLNVR